MGIRATLLILTGEAARVLDVVPDPVRDLKRPSRPRAVRTNSGVRVVARDEVEDLARARASVPTRTGQRV